jgi:hypothetical protein
MNQEKANEIFKTDIGIQLEVIYVTSDDKVFIRQSEALLHTNDMLNGDPENFVDTTITEWYNENHKTNKMKNLFLLPTDKPSRLYFNTKAKYYAFSYTVTSQGGSVSNRHIYITNDEEIKEGDWCYQTELPNLLEKCKNKEENWITNRGFKKIILTTDKDLIADGVQSIPDEFLEWFVKNPSCEEVEVREEEVFVGFIDGNGKKPIYDDEYKIIIPRTTQQIIDEDFSGGLDMGQVTPKEEPKQLAVEWLQEQLNKILIDNQIQQTLHLFEQAKQMEEEQRGYSEEHLIKVVEKFHSLQLNEFKSFLELLEFKKEEE